MKCNPVIKRSKAQPEKLDQLDVRSIGITIEDSNLEFFLIDRKTIQSISWHSCGKYPENRKEHHNYTFSCPFMSFLVHKATRGLSM